MLEKGVSIDAEVATAEPNKLITIVYEECLTKSTLKQIAKGKRDFFSKSFTSGNFKPKSM